MEPSVPVLSPLLSTVSEILSLSEVMFTSCIFPVTECAKAAKENNADITNADKKPILFFPKTLIFFPQKSFLRNKVPLFS